MKREPNWLLTIRRSFLLCPHEVVLIISGWVDVKHPLICEEDPFRRSWIQEFQKSPIAALQPCFASWALSSFISCAETRRHAVRPKSNFAIWPTDYSLTTSSAAICRVLSLVCSRARLENRSFHQRVWHFLHSEHFSVAHYGFYRQVTFIYSLTWRCSGRSDGDIFGNLATILCSLKVLLKSKFSFYHCRISYPFNRTFLQLQSQSKYCAKMWVFCYFVNAVTAVFSCKRTFSGL